MSRKSSQIAARIGHLAGSSRDPHYLGFFECFNRGEFYEAHDVLEELWLGCRKQPDDLFYKGLIQLAGAFVHYKKGRRQPGAALLRLASSNLSRYPSFHHGLDLAEVLGRINGWLSVAGDAGLPANPLEYSQSPQLHVASHLDGEGR